MIQAIRSVGTDYSDYWTPAPEGQVLVRRSKIDADVWYCTAVDMVADLTSLEAPGRIRAVKRYAEGEFSEGRKVRWRRLDPDTWVMDFCDERD